VLEPLTRSTRDDAIAFAAERPYENAFVQWVLEGGHGANVPDEILLYRRATGQIAGLVYAGTQLVIAADDGDAVDAVAHEARRYPPFRSIVGPSNRVGELWERLRSWHRPPILVRATQPLYALLPDAHVATGDLAVRQATLADADTVIENSAEMMLGELGYDPRVNRTSFGAGVRRAIAQGQWWVCTEAGQLRFQLNVGARTTATAQLQGVWTPPAARKRGYAQAALSGISAALLRTNPTLSLYVNDFNHDAITLYERVGFARVGEMSTLLFA
jgi:ribosomal protein S18 acetylase RimI-like enzyme